MNKPGPKPKRAAAPAWTPDVAYACGLIATDGCLISDGRHIDFTSKDIEQLKTFKRCFGIDCKISQKLNGSNMLVTRLQFSDVVLYNWFLSIGITPHKSFTIAKIDIPDEYFFDFLRGEFDGDGSSHAYWDVRWRSSVCVYMNFTCASHDHLEWLSKNVVRLIGAKGRIQKSKNCYVLRYAKKATLAIYDAMYYNNQLPYLSRKKEKLDRQLAASKTSREQKLFPKNTNNGSVICIT